MPRNLVGYSRAGDVFHYRWAARRCLGLVYPNTQLQKIVIEGSSENTKAGEYVIDVSEYYVSNESINSINYFQLKHSTLHEDDDFTLSTLKGTIEGFAKRFVELSNDQNFDAGKTKLSFIVITNRKIAQSLKSNISAISKSERVTPGFKKTLENYTKLRDAKLAQFCSLLELEDGHGDYNEQKWELRKEIGQLIAGSFDNEIVDSLAALVQEKVLPDSKEGKITQEDVLKKFKATSILDLFPASSNYDVPPNLIYRSQYHDLSKIIVNAVHPVIIHASGGVGKTIFAQYIKQSLPDGSVGIVYDCFGAGSYRNESKLRHGHRHALVQIINELSSQGLCPPLIIQNGTLDEHITRRFISNLEMISSNIRKINEAAILLIVIDAADNAVMASNEYGQTCFVPKIINESFPACCRVVFLSRTERTHLLQANSLVKEFGLNAFSKEETFEFLQKTFWSVSKLESDEFHRLTSGNPRVQANLLDKKDINIDNILEILGPEVLKVEDQIEAILDLAVTKIKLALTIPFQSEIDSICLGLAILPPLIPLEILSKTSKVSIPAIRSFVSEFGRYIRISESFVQFQDEPTEDWFVKKFKPSVEDYEEYIAVLESLAEQSTYVSQLLPRLYLKSEQYDKLIEISLSDKLLPENPIDARAIRVYRLKYSFHAALKSKKYKDSLMIAMRAGEEVAGNNRQNNLLKNNIDLLLYLKSKNDVEDIALNRTLRGEWWGSENIYTASLLSEYDDFKGEASGYFRSAKNWLNLYYDEQKKYVDYPVNGELDDRDILELFYTSFNLNGIKSSIEFLEGFSSKEFIFDIFSNFVERLIDFSNFETIDDLLIHCKNKPYFIVAITNELGRIGIFPKGELIANCLTRLNSEKNRIKFSESTLRDNIKPAIISFLEACINQGLPKNKILSVLEHYFPMRAASFVSNDYYVHQRHVFLRALSLRLFLQSLNSVNYEEIIPNEYIQNDGGKRQESDIKVFSEIVDRLLPWFNIRLRVIVNSWVNVSAEIETIITKNNQNLQYQYSNNKKLPSEIASLLSKIFKYHYNQDESGVIDFYNRYLRDNIDLDLNERISLVRSAYRIKHLNPIKLVVENEISGLIPGIKDNHAIPEMYLNLARAVMVGSKENALIYFDSAVKYVSKFGDEIVSRWDSIVLLAEKASLQTNTSDELAYRFMRCAEVVGNTVDREKDWSRSKAIQICTRMSPNVTIPALSRWIDRQLPKSDWLLEDVLEELIKVNKINSSLGWSLVTTINKLPSLDFLKLCIEKEEIQDIRNKIFDDAINKYHLEISDASFWETLRTLAINFNFDNSFLNQSENKFPQIIKPLRDNIPAYLYSKRKKNKRKPEVSWTHIFENLNVTQIHDIDEALLRFELQCEALNLIKNYINFGKEVIKIISADQYWELIDNLLQSQKLEFFDFIDIYKQIPEVWFDNISVKLSKPGLIRKISRRYAIELLSTYKFGQLIKELILDANLIFISKEGIHEGLVEERDMSKSNIYFDFVKLSTSFLDKQEAESLVDYSLDRIEKHIFEDEGDGLWTEKLTFSNDLNDNLVAFIWTSLGSPSSDVRWRAAHTMRQLYEFECFDFIDEIVKLLVNGGNDAFIDKRFPFYELNAKLYFFIAMARISLCNVDKLLKHSKIFYDYAIEYQHILIQKFSSDVAINIEKKFPSTYNELEYLNLSEIELSPRAIETMGYSERRDSVWHPEGTVLSDINFYCGYDFEQYWYEPLGRVFGIPNVQVADLVKTSLVADQKISNDGSYDSEPRKSLLTNMTDNESHHSHGDHPSFERYNFYLSYHYMFKVATKLLNNMSVISTKESDSNSWKEWLKRHILISEKGYWKSDYRNPLPMRPFWINYGTKENWLNKVEDEDFLNCVKILEGNQAYLRVKGEWHEMDDEYREKYTVSSAFVSNKTSESLLYALENSKSDIYWLPGYEEEYEDDEQTEEECNSDFKMFGWISNDIDRFGLDDMDPIAKNLDNPTYSIGSKYLDEMHLKVDKMGRNWFSGNSDVPDIMKEVWANEQSYYQDYPYQKGIHIKCSIHILKEYCAKNNLELIMSISITRDTLHKNQEGYREYNSPVQKIYILSSEGNLRNGRSDYQIG